MPVDELKIDHSFIERMAASRDTSIVAATIRLAHDIGLTTVAEGVEFDVVAERLRALGCDVMQGYYVSRPLMPEDVPRWLSARAAAGAGRPAMRPLG